MVWHLGDLGYADDGFASSPISFAYEHIYDGWMNWMQTITSTKPYMVSPGVRLPTHHSHLLPRPTLLLCHKAANTSLSVLCNLFLSLAPLGFILWNTPALAPCTIITAAVCRHSNLHHSNPLHSSAYASVLCSSHSIFRHVASNSAVACAGNHEAECHSRACGAFVSHTAKGKKLSNFTAYNARWTMPYASSGSRSNMWYSYDYSSAHIVSLSSETDFQGELVPLLPAAHTRLNLICLISHNTCCLPT